MQDFWGGRICPLTTQCHLVDVAGISGEERFETYSLSWLIPSIFWGGPGFVELYSVSWLTLYLLGSGRFDWSSLYSVMCWPPVISRRLRRFVDTRRSREHPPAQGPSCWTIVASHIISLKMFMAMDWLIRALKCHRISVSSCVTLTEVQSILPFTAKWSLLHNYWEIRQLLFDPFQIDLGVTLIFRELFFQCNVHKLAF